MARARKITIKTRTFEKAGDATVFFKEMLNRYAIGETVNPKDAADLSALLELHDERDTKVGVGIDYFKVDKAPEPYSGQCFWLVRTDETVEDFSYIHCLAPKPTG